MTRISVALATYNGQRFLKAQLDSLAAQRHLPLELHVGDDGSSDDSLAILEEFARHAPFPVFVRRNPERLNVTANFMMTASRCSGDWIAFCDQDDVWLPDKLAAVAAGIAASGPDLRLVAHNAVITDEDLGARHLKAHWWGTKLMPRLTLPPHWASAGFCQIFHRRLIDDVPWVGDAGNGRDGILNTHDRWIPALALATGSVLLLGEALALYRRHDANVSPDTTLEAVSRTGWLMRALGNNGSLYAKQIRETGWTADLLEEAAGRTHDAETKFLLGDAAAKIRIFCGHLAERAGIYRKPRLADRLGHMGRLIAGGGYARSRVCSFGPRAMIKDLAYAALPFRRD
ncbi:glycosyltransferase [Sphingosinicella rhizophila]|uniref:Glycosyltransferase n=1 Tax=Sphingosinicella rhizophila TaxID=3050082 RepID=A0ABU3QA16_9SPHN|nr:glycosyltransferase [Sphingosinicella sp. GR2756]MDT9600137.1 glycosyltransferase [Sphingosinicella sp. GR2756]